jgi:hypothetical protein
MFSHIWAADSGDVVSAIYTQGSAHPPGFPIYYLLGSFFRFITPFGTPAQKVGLVSLIFSLLTVIVFYKFVRLTDRKNFNILAFIAALILFIFSFSWALYSLVPEIYTASVFLISLNAFFLAKYLLTNRDRAHHLFLLTFFIGLFFHYVILLSLVPYLFFQRHDLGKLRQFFSRNWPLALLYVFIGFLPYLLFYIIWQADSVIFWQEHSPKGLLALATRSQYGFFSTSSHSYQPFLDKFSNLVFYGKLAVGNLTLIGVFLSLFGFFYLLRKRSPPHRLIVLLCLLYGPFLFFYTDANPEKSFSQGVLERYFLLSLFFIALSLYFGFLFVIKKTRLLAKRIIHSRVIYKLLLFGFSAFLLIFFPLGIALKTSMFICKIRSQKIFSQHVSNLFANLPKNSLVLLSKDTHLFPALYYRYAANKRPDLAVASISKLNNYAYLQVLKTNFPSLKLPQKNSQDLPIKFISLNLAKHPVFTNTFLKNPHFKLYGHGLLDEVRLRKSPGKKRAEPPLNINFLRFTNNPYPLYFVNELVEFYAQFHHGQAIKLSQQNKDRRSLEQIAKAYYLDNTNSSIASFYALSLYKNNKCARALAVLEHNFSVSPHAEAALLLSNMYASCKQDKFRYLFWQKKYQQLK